jgi:EAL domain-containing protein (putative c-di-GMP-specific phosphodiesterase class I)/FixJ family two-component response regulator
LGEVENESRVLILDDDETVGVTIGVIVEASGYEARVTATFPAFLEALASWRPAFVMLDLNMPDVDGIEVLRQLAERRYGGSVVISSGLDRRVLEAAERSAVEHGLRVLGFLPKPFRAAELRAMLRQGSVEAPKGDIAPRPSVTSSLDAATLREGLHSGAVTTVYQPKVACSDGRLVGFEALARWQHPTLGSVPPDRFIPLAEREGVIDDLTEVLFTGALRWLVATFPDDDLALSFNLSARSLGDMRMADTLVGICQRVGAAPTRVILELTETASADDEVTALDVLTRFRIQGLALSIDDFGTGHSTLVQLARQPFSEIKIDKQFVMGAQRSAESRTIIQAMISLGHGLGLAVTAEGVEDGATLAFLREHGCDMAQGYHIARPMAAEAIVDWRARRERARA